MIIDQATKEGAELIIVGTRGLEHRQELDAGIGEHARHAPCAVQRPRRALRRVYDVVVAGGRRKTLASRSSRPSSTRYRRSGTWSSCNSARTVFTSRSVYSRSGFKRVATCSRRSCRRGGPRIRAGEGGGRPGRGGGGREQGPEDAGAGHRRARGAPPGASRGQTRARGRGRPQPGAPPPRGGGWPGSAFKKRPEEGFGRVRKKPGGRAPARPRDSRPRNGRR